jgi:hypothetical protein
MFINVNDFEFKILKMISITNKNIKREKEYLEQLEEECGGYWTVGDSENPHQIIPKVEVNIKCLEEQVRTYETAIDIAKSLLHVKIR